MVTKEKPEKQGKADKTEAEVVAKANGEAQQEGKEPEIKEEEKVEYSVSGGLVAKLANLNISIAFTSYQSGLLYFVGRNGETVTGRVGLVLESRNSKVDKFAGFVGTNLYFNLAGDTEINVSGEAYDYARHDGWFELSAGGTYKLRKGLGLYGQVDLGTSIDSFGDSNSAKGELGVRGWW